MKDAVLAVFNEFASKEMGNKLTQFNLTGLHAALVQAMAQAEAEEATSPTED